MIEHHFHLAASWPGGRNNVNELQCGGLDSHISIGASMDGPGVGTSPDEMLLGAAATCYLITLAAMIERTGLAVTEMSIQSELTVNVDGSTCRCRKIIHRPAVTLARSAGNDARQKPERLITMADRRCMLSNALRGNVEIELQPELAGAD